MSDYISREAAYESLLNGMVMTGYQSRALDCISEFSIPAADVRPVVKAKIVDMRYTEDDGEWKCSHCGWQFTLCVCGKDVTSKIHFCPNCGAAMGGT